MILTQDIIIKEALLVTRGKDLEKLIREKYNISFWSTEMLKYLRGSEYKTTMINNVYIYKDLLVSSYNIKLLSYYIGYFIGDGMFKGKLPLLKTTNRKYFSKLKDELPLSKYYFYKSEQYTSGEMIYLQSYSDNFSKFMFNLGFPKRKTYVNYKLNLELIDLDIVEFTAGLIDSDGWKCRNRYFYLITSALDLFLQIKEVILKDLVRAVKGQQCKNVYLYQLVLKNDFARRVNSESVYLNKRM